jgi:hypothetical protein
MGRPRQELGSTEFLLVDAASRNSSARRVGSSSHIALARSIARAASTRERMWLGTVIAKRSRLR